MTHPPQTPSEREWLAAIIASSDDAIIAKDLHGRVTAWNAAAERLFGYTATEMLGRSLTAIFPAARLHEEAAILQRIASGERIEQYETERCDKNGRVFPVSVTISPIRNAAGDIAGASNITRDLSERERSARRLRDLQAELVHVQRVSELSQFFSSLVHEINQPLTAITNYLSACRRLAAAGNLGGITTALTRVDDQIGRTRDIVQRIRDFIKKRDMEVRTENLAEVVGEAIALTYASARSEDLIVRADVHPAAIVQVDKVQVQQVLFNLLRNGIEAMQLQQQRELSVVAQPAGDDMMEVSVTDSGPGLSDEIQRRLFQPFVTTKPDGMGMGLSVCRTIIEAHGGRLWAENAGQRGAIFRFTLKVPREAAGPSAT